MDWSIVFVGLPVLLLVLVAIRLATLRRGWSLGQSLVGVAAGAFLSGALAVLAAGLPPAAWRDGLLLAALGFLVGALAVLAATAWQRRASR
jgi:hypothetical protein